MEFERKAHYTVADLCRIMQLLRSENGCPWDRVQTHESIRKNLIEETYEAVEAIDCKNSDMLKEELGDVLLQVVFHAQMEAEEGRFTFDDVADGICQKLIVRHPHIFSDTKADSADEVLDNWNRIKQETKGQKTATETLNAVPRQLPALIRSDARPVLTTAMCRRLTPSLEVRLTSLTMPCWTEISLILRKKSVILCLQRLMWRVFTIWIRRSF